MDESMVKTFETVLAEIADLERITLDEQNKVVTFSLGQIDLEVIETIRKKESSSCVLEKTVPLGKFDIIIADGSDEPLIRNLSIRRQYGRLKNKPDLLTWDHPHVMDMIPQSRNYLDTVALLIKGERWAEVISTTIIFLTTAVVDGDMSLKMLKKWGETPTEAETVSAT